MFKKNKNNGHDMYFFGKMNIYLQYVQIYGRK